jgi:hypothetical protein
MLARCTAGPPAPARRRDRALGADGARRAAGGGAAAAARAAAAPRGAAPRRAARRAPLRVAAAAPAPPSLAPSPASTTVRMATLPTCQLAVSYYPTFAYKAQDGGGAGRVRDLGGGKLGLTFDPDSARGLGGEWREAGQCAVAASRDLGWLDPGAPRRRHCAVGRGR